MTYKWKNFVKPKDEVLKKNLTKEEYDKKQNEAKELLKGLK